MKINDIFQKYSKLLNTDYIDNPKLESEILICFVLNLDKKDFLLKKDTAEINKNDIDKINILINKRLYGKSIAEIINSKYFYDKNFFVNENVLIPRPETELLIDIALKYFESDLHFNILEIGCGSGIISIILSNYYKNALIDSLDISKAALEVAKINIDKNAIYKKNINIINKDFFYFTPVKQYDLIISNPPYIPVNEVKKLIEDKIVSDPFISLNGGKDGLDFYKEINKFSQNNLNKNGKIIIEHGINQRKKIIDIFHKNIFEYELFDDLSGIDRAILLKKRI